ncbi:MAG: hypothetical protein YFSK_1540 [Candidatus Yanofskyibacterium parasiticum]|jgi:hypothetical protein|nr:MAG: hypothetical protein YFSK_1540 [Candidatus Yanofskybacteria bacterium]
MNKKFLFRSLILFLLTFYVNVLSAFANSSERCVAPKEIELQIKDWPTAPIGGYTLDGTSKLPDLIAYFFGWGVGLGGLAVFIALIIAGVQLITSVADPGKMNDAKSRIKSAVIGLGLLLSSWAIFQLINPNLTNLSEPKSNIVNQTSAGVLAFTDEKCSSREDCCLMDDPNCPNGQTCPKITNPACNLRFWACCKDNDNLCLATGNEVNLQAQGGECTFPGECKTQNCQPSKDNPAKSICIAGTKGVGDSCTLNGECASAFCNYGKCNNKKTDGESCEFNNECASGKCLCDTSVWQKKCAPNPKVCNMIFDKGELGCDIVRFYELRDFEGKYIDFKYEPVYPSGSVGEDKRINSDWVLWQGGGATPWGTLPSSYQAFVYRRDAYGKILFSDAGKTQPLMMPCGETACGCTINRCLAVEAGGKCAKSSADESSGQFSEFAYNTNMVVQGVKIQDKTKFTYLQKGADFGQQVEGFIKSAWCTVIGCD